MTKEETAKIMAVLQAAYPHMYIRKTEIEMEAAVNMWRKATLEYSYASVSGALYAFIRTDASGYPPSPGQIVDMIHKLEDHDETSLSAEEAWTLVSRASSDSNYHSHERFGELPPVVQRAVGSPEILRQMGAMEVNELNTVQKSLFFRQFAAAVSQQNAEAKIPQAIKDNAVIEQNRRTAVMISDANERRAALESDISAKNRSVRQIDYDSLLADLKAQVKARRR